MAMTKDRLALEEEAATEATVKIAAERGLTDPTKEEVREIAAAVVAKARITKDEIGRGYVVDQVSKDAWCQIHGVR